MIPEKMRVTPDIIMMVGGRKRRVAAVWAGEARAVRSPPASFSLATVTQPISDSQHCSSYSDIPSLQMRHDLQGKGVLPRIAIIRLLVKTQDSQHLGRGRSALECVVTNSTLCTPARCGSGGSGFMSLHVRVHGMFLYS